MHIQVGATAMVLALGQLPAAFADASDARNPRQIDRQEYQRNLRAMWQAQCVANWTGLRSEGRRTWAPFLTDADWGSTPFPEAPWATLEYLTWLDPWPSDDDTDVEYVYLHALSGLNANRLTPSQIAGAWTAHVNTDIWVSNATARALMSRGVLPPMTAAAQGWARLPSGGQSGEHMLMIDAQLTTEFFGALCPGMPERALAMADLPIRTTAWGYAVHASQFYVVLYSLASQVNTSLTGEQQALWLVREGRKYLPETSVSSEVIDFVLADYLANPDKSDWESTRDKVYQRFQINAAANGTRYWGWFESKVNLATGVIALLYGQMDFRRTVQIGTLSGWDSDNGTATMGGLIGLVQGPAFNKAGYGWGVLSDRYWISRTRQNLPDYTPADPQAEDTFTLMAARMMPIADREIVSAGGQVDAGRWLLPPGGAGPGVSPLSALGRSPTRRLMLQSANNAVRAAGGSVAAITSVAGAPPSWDFGWPMTELWTDGAEHDASGREPAGTFRGFSSTYRVPASPGVAQWVGVVYDRPVLAKAVRFIMAETYTAGAVQGGWCASAPTLELLIDGAWTSVPATASAVPGPQTPWAIVDLTLPSPTICTGARITCLPGGTSAFLTIAEVDVMAPDSPLFMPTLDLNADGSATIDDLYAAYEPGRLMDLNADALTDQRDIDFLEVSLRFGEAGGMASGPGGRGSRPGP